MILLPKIYDASRIENFWPIVLSNFIYKIITKLIADHLAKVASRIIAQPQFSFLPGRHIKDCIAIASENINILDKAYLGGNVAIKIDIKAFNTLEWSFIL